MNILPKSSQTRKKPPPPPPPPPPPLPPPQLCLQHVVLETETNGHVHSTSFNSDSKQDHEKRFLTFGPTNNMFGIATYVCGGYEEV